MSLWIEAYGSLTRQSELVTDGSAWEANRDHSPQQEQAALGSARALSPSSHCPSQFESLGRRRRRGAPTRGPSVTRFRILRRGHRTAAPAEPERPFGQKDLAREADEGGCVGGLGQDEDHGPAGPQVVERRRGSGEDA